MSTAQKVKSPLRAAVVPQSVKAQLRLRELILSGELSPGQRIAELALVERLGVSRTPVRAALAALHEEGLLEVLPGGGFAVREFGEADIRDAIELRGTLEGLAARLAAERGAPAALLSEANEVLDRLDAVVAAPTLDDASFGGYVELNGRFHELLARMCGGTVVARELARVKRLPFASPNSFVLVGAISPRARDVLLVAQAQHRAVIDAILRHEGARAEALMREHARIAQRNLDEALQDHLHWQRIPGASLVRWGAGR